MTPTTHRLRPLIVASALAALTLTGLPMAQAAATGAGARSAHQDTVPVSYRGLTLDVPQQWKVVDLEKAPATCVRFDSATVYLGHPGTEQSCPADPVGQKTDALVIEPLAGATVLDPAAVIRVPAGGRLPDRLKENTDREVRIALEGAGLLITASHGTSTEAISAVVRSGKVGGGARPGALATEPAAGMAAPRTALAAAAPTTGYTGKAFDACAAPSDSAMTAWQASPFRGVGIYIGGPTRVCAQPNLTAGWVGDRTADGWHMLAIYAGLQAGGVSATNGMQQGRASADDAVAKAKGLGFAPSSVIYTDMEPYSSTAYRTRVMDYVSGFSARVRELGYRAGVYVNASNSPDMAALHNNSRYAKPDVLWSANWNGLADVSNSSMNLPGSTYWGGRRRVHQYRGDIPETFGGVRINIDYNYVDVAGAALPSDVVRDNAASRVNGDFNGDGRDDVAAMYGYEDGSVALFTFLAKADGGFADPVKSWSVPPKEWWFEHVKLSAGDFNGDGRADLAAMYDYSDGSVALFTFLAQTDGGFNAPVKSWNVPPGQWWPEHVQLASGDFDGNGRDELAAFYGYADARAALFTFKTDTAGRFAAPVKSWNVPENSWWGKNVKLASGDFDGNGRDDVAAFYGYDDGRAALFTFKSTTTGGFSDPVKSWNVPERSWWGENVKLTAGDYDGDKRADVAVMYGYDDGAMALFTFKSAADGGFAAPVKSWNVAPENWWAENVQIASGDFDGNGRSDVAAFYGYTDGRSALFTFKSDAGGLFGTPLKSWNVPEKSWWGDHVKLG
ncbi:glycoside hydrolase domain-containing protein [Streptomyces sp. NPDC003038]|uniref:glycoside hydrolase domain-containing protein n=1 Tax=unclassified Streptomyces TaxID=2593676 RepID=UPI0033B00FA5